MAAADTAKLVAELTLDDKMTKGLASATKSVDKFDKRLSKIGSQAGRGIGNAAKNIERIAVIGFGGLVAGVGASVKAAADYQSAFAGVRKTVDATEPELAALEQQFRDMAKTIPITAVELAKLGEAGGALGVDPKNLEEFVRVTALLGETTDLTAEQAADSVGILTNVLHLTEPELSKFGSSLVALGNAGASTESQIIGIAQRAGAAGELIGLSTEQVLGFSSAVASIGIEEEAGGSSLQSFFINATKMIAAGGDELDTFAKTAGTSAAAFKKAYDVDAGGALQSFLAGLGKLDQAQQLQVLSDLGFEEIRISRTLLGLANNTELVADQLDVANTAFKENTALTKEANERFKTFDSQVQLLKNNLTDVGITIGSKLLPILAKLVTKVNEFLSLKTTSTAIEGFATRIAATLNRVVDAFRAPSAAQFEDTLRAASGYFERIVSVAERIDWSAIGDSFRVAGTFAGKLLDVFLSMPPWVQTAVLTGWGLNKLTGGALGSIVSELASGLIKGVLGINAGVVNVNAASVAGVAGAAGAATGGGKMAALTSAVRVIGAVSIAAGSILALKEVFTGVRTDIKNQADAVHETSKAQIANQNTTTADLEKALAATNTGIRELQQNPFFFLLGNEALASLEKQRDEIQRAIREQEKSGKRTDDAIGRAAASINQSAGKNADDLAAVSNANAAKTVAVMNQRWADFTSAVKALKSATDPATIAKAAQAIAAKIVGGAGNTANTADVLATLKSQRATAAAAGQTQLVQILDKSIDQVAAKLANRQFVDKQLAALKAIQSDGKITNEEMRDLQKIERDLLAHGDRQAAAIIAEARSGKQTTAAGLAAIKERQAGFTAAIQAGFGMTAAAARATTEAVKDKDLSVTVPVTVNNTVSLSGITMIQKRQSRVTGRIGGL